MLLEDKESALSIEELIVVEGKNDAHAVRKALGKVDIIWTEGFGLTEEKLVYIAEMAKRKGVIVCTDPDFAGKQIRERIKKRVPEAKHVYVSKACALSKKGDDIGLENVSEEEIRQAFAKVMREGQEKDCQKSLEDRPAFSMDDMHLYGLVGKPKAAEKRAVLGKLLGIGDTNAKQFLHRVRRYGLSREELLVKLEAIERKGV